MFFLTGDSWWLTANKKSMWNNEFKKKGNFCSKRHKVATEEKCCSNRVNVAREKCCLLYYSKCPSSPHGKWHLCIWQYLLHLTSLHTTCKNPPPPWVVPCQLVVLHLSSSIPVFTDFVGISSWFLGPNQVIKVWKGWLFQENSRTSSIDFCGSKMVRQLAALKGQIPSKKHRFYDLLVPPLDFLKMYWKWCESTHIYAANLQLGQNQIGAEMSCIWNYQKLSMIDIDKFLKHSSASWWKWPPTWVQQC